MAQSIPLKLGERTYSLRYDMNAIGDLEDELDLPIQKILVEERVGVSTLRAMLWAGLKWRLPKLTPREAGTLLQEHVDAGGDFEEVAGAMIRALAESGVMGQGAKEAAREVLGEPEGNRVAEAAAPPASATG